MELSRSTRCQDITIVGPRDFAIQKLYDTLCKINQYTRMTETIVHKLSLTPTGAPSDDKLIDYADVWPFRISDIILPTTPSGFIYSLVSVPCPDKRYVGYTRNLGRRVDEHNEGRGSFGTSHDSFIPWTLCSYICGLGHLSDSELMSMEWKWQHKNARSLQIHHTGIEHVIENGNSVCQEHNGRVGDKLHQKGNFVITLSRTYAFDLAGQCLNNDDLDFSERTDA